MGLCTVRTKAGQMVGHNGGRASNASPFVFKTRIWARKTDPEQTVPKTGDRGPETGAVYRLHQVVTNGPRTVDGFSF